LLNEISLLVSWLVKQLASRPISNFDCSHF